MQIKLFCFNLNEGYNRLNLSCFFLLYQISQSLILWEISVFLSPLFFLSLSNFIYFSLSSLILSFSLSLLYFNSFSSLLRHFLFTLYLFSLLLSFYLSASFFLSHFLNFILFTHGKKSCFQVKFLVLWMAKIWK